MLRLSITGLTSPLLPTPAPAVRLRPRPLTRLRLRALAAGAASSLSPSARSLRLLEWGKVCDAVASFAGTGHGRDATKKQLWEVEDVSYEQSQRLLQETEAAVWLLDNAGGAMDFSGLDTVAIESAIHCVSGGAVIKGLEAVAVASLMLFVESLQILDAVINKSLVKSIQDIVDDDGSVKDTAVGAGTNPLEGEALGMSLLESFAEVGSFLTLATTHHGELKTLKYSNNSFENACVEFDEENLKPTFKILWGIPGRSNAINIAERLGLPSDIVESSRRLLGTAGAEINALIMDMERFKQDYQQDLQKAQHLLMQSKELHNNLELARRNIVDHTSAQRKRKARVISEYAVMARSIIRKKFQQFQESAIAERLKEEKAVDAKSERVKDPMPTSTTAMGKAQKTDTNLATAADDEEDGIPEVGDSVYVPKLKNQATVVKIDSSKNEVQVQAGMMKLKLKLQDVKVQKRKVSR
ncbi:endonuclease MutS2 isoform X1 [Panicum miliaceum]|uniref:Endonuclease MutS2 isoform X1 n=1 Tax=Panicum miliaceum TaxID=4540 RepID=A0A3L6S785_PANMI|nr:endonuclease MutS2 isoform X1 [Panicum miliaceum]